MSRLVFRGYRYAAVVNTLRTAAKLTMYHGTSAKYLRDVLKHGLRSNPPQRQFGEDAREFSSPSYQTFGGAYFTPVLAVAEEYADNAVENPADPQKFPDPHMLVIAQIETRSEQVVLDEDKFLNLNSAPLFDIFYEYYHKIGKEDPLEILQAIDAGQLSLDAYAQNWIANNHVAIHRKVQLDPKLLFPRYRDDVVKALWWALADKAAGNYERWGEDEQREILKDLNIPLSTRETRQHFVDVVTELSRKVQRLTDPQEGLQVRSLQDIGYRGANRIVGIVVYQYHKINKTLRGEVVYNQDAQAVMGVMRQLRPKTDRRLWTEKGSVVLDTTQEQQKAASTLQTHNSRLSTVVNTNTTGLPDARYTQADSNPEVRTRGQGVGGTTKPLSGGVPAHSAQHRQPPGRLSEPTQTADGTLRAAVGTSTATAPGTRNPDQTGTNNMTSEILRTAADPDEPVDEPMDLSMDMDEPLGGLEGEGEPSEYEMTKQLEKDPGANWRDLYLQPIIRAIRNRFDLEKGQVRLISPKKKIPFGSDTLGFEVVGHIRFDDYTPDRDDYGDSPFRFRAAVDINGELVLPVEVTGN